MAGVVLEGDDGAEEVLVGSAVEGVAVVVGEREGEQVAPQRRALVLSPGVGALVVGDEEVRVLVGQEQANRLLVDVELGHTGPPKAAPELNAWGCTTEKLRTDKRGARSILRTIVSF